MKITLEMVDTIINETGCDYRKAKSALESTEGDVTKAIEEVLEKQNEAENVCGEVEAEIEENIVEEDLAEDDSEEENFEEEAKEEDAKEKDAKEKEEAKKGKKEKISETTDELIDKLKKLVNSGIVNEILIEREEKVIINIPIIAGAASALIFIGPTLVAIVAALAAGCKIKIVLKDGRKYNLNEMTTDKYKDVRSNYSKKETRQTYSKTFTNDEDMVELEEEDLEDIVVLEDIVILEDDSEDQV